jgi:hypothetical protein
MLITVAVFVTAWLEPGVKQMGSSVRIGVFSTMGIKHEAHRKIL